jgi:carbamoyltransferase|tara:strand:+ start:249 stop:1820 length:1572 start_codon:yes stop_codon:yes gene_type:complete
VNIIAIHTGHDGSVSVCSNNELVIHQKIDRYNKSKHNAYPSPELINKINSLDISFDIIIFTAISDRSVTDLWQDIFKNNLLRFNKGCKVYMHLDKHHDFHAFSSAWFFKEDIDYHIVWDGNGSTSTLGDTFYCLENTSIYDNRLNILFKQYHTADNVNYTHDNSLISSNLQIGKAYEQVVKELNLGVHNEGKAMALSSWGKVDKDLKKELLFNNSFSSNYFKTQKDFLISNLNYYRLLPNLNTDIDNKDSQNFLKTFQSACEEIAFNFVDKYKSKTIALSGGVTQNILINSHLTKTGNKILANPLCSDEGVSIGALYYYTQGKLKNRDTLYLGFNPEYNLDVFKGYKIIDITVEEVAKIVNKEPVALFQGPSEQGQRGLGNRSLLMNAFDRDCLNKINLIKKREWYRPFACSILKEKLKEWFYDIGVDNSYMMFVLKSKKNLKNVVSKDNLCRVQSVDIDQNYHYYNLLRQYNMVYKTPLLLNTSLNMPGHTLVETLDDLRYMFEHTELKYAWLPELQKLILK